MPKDTIQFELVAEKTVVSSTIKMTASIVGLVNKTDLPESTLTTRVQEMMKKFIDVKWNFANMQRSQDQSGMERVTLEASARVSETENRDIDGRTRAVSTQGLNILRVQTDTTPPLAEIEKAESGLRASLMTKAVNEVEVINKAMGGSFRVSKISFDSAQGDVFSLSNAPRSPKTAMAASYGTSFGADASEGLGNAVKLTMRASIQYRRNSKE